jgi:hypothetical protein
MELWEWYCGKVLPTVCQNWRDPKVRASQPMHTCVHFSDEVFVFVELTRNLSKWMSKPLNAALCQTSHINLVGDLKLKAPGHYLGCFIISREYFSETDQPSGDEFIYWKSRYMVQATRSGSVYEDTEENEETQLVDKTSFWDKDTAVLDIYRDLDELDKNPSASYANAVERMEEVVFVTRLIKLLRTSPYSLQAETHYQQKADEHWQDAWKKKQAEKEKRKALQNKKIDYEELFDVDMGSDSDEDE